MEGLELAGWRVEIADAVKVKGLAPLACTTDRIDAWVLAELARRDLVPAIWRRRSGCPTRLSAPNASGRGSDFISFVTAPASSSACTPSCSPTASRIRSPTSSASRAATCSRASAQRRLRVFEPAVRARPPHIHDPESTVDVELLEREQLRRWKPGSGREHNHWPVDRAEPVGDRLDLLPRFEGIGSPPP
jgi:hypothetical protein